MIRYVIENSTKSLASRETVTICISLVCSVFVRFALASFSDNLVTLASFQQPRIWVSHAQISVEHSELTSVKISYVAVRCPRAATASRLVRDAHRSEDIFSCWET